MDLVDEEHIVVFQAGEQSGQVARLVDHRPRGDLDIHAQFIGDDVREGGLAQSRGAVQQHMVEGFLALLGRFHKHLQVFHHLELAGKLFEFRRPQYLFYFQFCLAQMLSPGVKIFVHEVLFCGRNTKLQNSPER